MSKVSKEKRLGFRPLADQTSRLIDPILRKKAGLTIELFESWPEIVGTSLAASSRPLRIAWPRRREGDAPLKSATLIIACEGLTGLKIQHESQEIIQRLNGIFGFCAIDKIKIEQRPIAAPRPPAPIPHALTQAQHLWLEGATVPIENAALRESLVRLGGAILADQS